MGMSTVDELNDVEIIEGVNSDGEEILKESNPSPQVQMSEANVNESVSIHTSDEVKTSEEVKKPEVMEEVQTPEQIIEEVIEAIIATDEVKVPEVEKEIEVNEKPETPEESFEEIEEIETSEKVELPQVVEVSQAVEATEVSKAPESAVPTVDIKAPATVEAPKEKVTVAAEVEVTETLEVVNTPGRILSMAQEDEEDEDDDDIDETILERLIGLGEMFPASVQNMTSKLIFGSISSVKGLYSFARSASWIVFSTSAILFAPIIFEVERAQMEEMQKQQQRQILLGPGAALSGGGHPGMGMAPPPPR